jgi:hypothetical protein
MWCAAERGWVAKTSLGWVPYQGSTPRRFDPVFAAGTRTNSNARNPLSLNRFRKVIGSVPLHRLIEALVVHIPRLVEGSMIMERRAASGNTRCHRLIAVSV